MRPKTACATAITAIYLSDSSDYCSALWDIVKYLNPEAWELLARDESAAYDKFADRENIELD